MLETWMYRSTSLQDPCDMGQTWTPQTQPGIPEWLQQALSFGFQTITHHWGHVQQISPNRWFS